MRANIGWIILIISLFTLHAQSNISSTVATGQPLRAASSDSPVPSPEGNSIDITLSYRWHDHNCLRFDGGFADVAGSFASVGYSRSNLLRMREILALSAEVGVPAARSEIQPVEAVAVRQADSNGRQLLRSALLLQSAARVVDIRISTKHAGVRFVSARRLAALYKARLWRRRLC